MRPTITSIKINLPLKNTTNQQKKNHYHISDSPYFLVFFVVLITFNIIYYVHLQCLFSVSFTRIYALPGQKFLSISFSQMYTQSSVVLNQYLLDWSLLGQNGTIQQIMRERKEESWKIAEISNQHGDYNHEEILSFL